MNTLYKAKLLISDGVITVVYANGTQERLSKDQLRTFLLTFKAQCDQLESISELKHLAKDVVAIIDPSGVLKVYDSLLFHLVYDSPVRYIPLTEYAKKHNKQRSILCRYCREGRIPGAIQQEQRWLIPEDAPYPNMERRGPKSL